MRGHLLVGRPAHDVTSRSREPFEFQALEGEIVGNGAEPALVLRGGDDAIDGEGHLKNESAHGSSLRTEASSAPSGAAPGWIAALIRRRASRPEIDSLAP